MSKVTFQLRYDGPALSEHGMDVADLAPALLALGELIKRANATFNGDAAKVNLIVQSDFEHKCFQINLELIQSILSSIGTLLADHLDVFGPGLPQARPVGTRARDGSDPAPALRGSYP